METHTKTVGTHELIRPDWETVKAWVRRAFTRERVADVVVCVSTVTVLGMILHSLNRALQNHTIVGF